MLKVLRAILPHFDKADTLFKVVLVLQKVINVLREEIAAMDNQNQTPPAAGLAAA